MARNLVTQTLNILQGGVKEAGKDYFSNMISFYNDAKNVKNTLINSGTDVSDTFARLKRTNVTKAISDWFYQEESSSEMELNGNTDEFDPGFKSSDSDSPKLDGESSKPSGLTVDAMMNISNKQTNAILKVGRRQNEQSVANTAEIISTIDTRSAEMITSLNNINKTLLSISSRLDKIIELQAVPLTDQKEIDKGGLYQDGNLSLMRIFEATKQNVLTTGPMSLLTTGIDMLRSGSLTPTTLASIGIKGLAGKIKVNGKSFDDWGNAFNELIGTATQTAMNEMINSNFFQKYIGKITGFEGDKDYGTIVPNHYDNKRAVFDGMTRQSIVNIIPEMLAKINESISGQSYSLDSRGKWVAGPAKNEFTEVTRASFGSSGLKDNAINSISNAGVQSIGKKIPTADIEKAAKALTMAIVMNQHTNGDRAFTISQLKGDLTNQVIQACEVLSMTGGDPKYWAKVCNSIIIQLSSGMMDAAGFVRNVNDSVQRMINEATQFAQSGKQNASQASKLSFNMAANQFLEQYAPKAETAKIAESQNKGTLIDGKNIRVDESNKVGKFSVNQYIGGIFYLLNRGINVRIDKDGSKYDGINLADVKPDSVPYVSDDTFGKMVKGMLAGNKNAVSDAVKEEMGVTKKEKGFISKILDNPAMLFNSLTNMFTGGSVNFQGLKDKAKGILGEEKYNAIADKLSGVKDRITNDDRYIAAKLAAEETVEKLKNKGNELYDKFGRTRIGNNMMYAKDSLKLKAAEDTINHMKIDDEMDQEAVAIAKYYTSRGMLDEAASAVSGIKNENVKTAFLNFVSIQKKRLLGQQALAEGETPDIGSILIEKDIKEGKDGKSSTTNSLLFKILGIVGKIGKFVGNMATRGISNIFYGLKSMGQALFGYEDFDPVKGIKYKNKGIFRNLTTELVAAQWRTAKHIVNGISNRVFGEGDAEFVDGKLVNTKKKTLHERYNDKIDKLARTKTIVDENGFVIDSEKSWLNKTAIGSYSREAKFVDGKFQGYKLRQDTAMTYADTLKHPIEAVSKALGNFKQNLDFVGEKAVEGVKTAITEVSGFLGNLKANIGKAWTGFKSTKVGNALTNNKITRGFFSGWNQAKQARLEKQQKKKKEEDRYEHPLQAEIVDSISPTEGQATGHKKKSIFHEIYEKLFGSKNDSVVSLLKKQVDFQEEEASENKNNNTDDESGKKKGIIERGKDFITSAKTKVTSMFSSEKDISPADGAAVAGGGMLSHIGNTLGSMAKMFGGFLQMFAGVAELIGSIVMSLEGFQALRDLVKSILVDGLKPLNEVFYTIIDLIKPVTKVLTKIVKVIAETISTIANAIIDTISPIIEALEPIFDSLFKILSPILKVVTVILDVVLMPIKMILEVCQPLFEGIAYRVQAVSGILEMGVGFLMSGLGKIITGIGFVADLLGKFLPGDDKEVDVALGEVGLNIMNGADEMMDQGKQDFLEGIEGAWGKLLEFFTGTPYEGKSKEVISEAYGVPAKLGNDFGAGDVYTTNNYYGSGNPMDQHSYGNFMNMSNRGCGPVALADAYGRRSGNQVNPALLTGVMGASGTYDPSRGTSVSSMMAMGNAMGMGMRAGGVTAASLQQASPTNPITILGSGAGFGTRKGSNHYVNVVGSDKNGGTYVSNPLTGRIERHSTGNIVNNSKLGLYGSGDDSDLSEYGFSQDAQDSLNRLKEITNKLTGMFLGEDDSTTRARNKKAVEQMKNTLKKEDYDAVETQAVAELKNRYPKYEDETDDEYEKRIRLKLVTPEGTKLLVSFGSDKMKNTVEGKIASQNEGINSMMEADKASREALSAAYDSFKSQLASSSIESVTGAEMAMFEPIIHLTPELTKQEANGRYISSPVHDFFNATSVEGKVGANRSGGAKGTVYSAGRGGWFGNYGGPQNDEGVGSTGKVHEGVLLHYLNDAGDGNAIARAITGGTVTYVTKDKEGAGNGLGNAVKWRDSGGMYHWYMHMASIDKDVQEGTNIEPGQLIGYFGKSGLSDDSGSNVLRYVVTSAGPQGSTGDQGYINPFTYWQFRAMSDDLIGNSEKEKIYNYLVNHFGMSEAGAAGVMGVLSNEGMLEPEPYAAQMEGIFGNNKAEMSKKYSTLEAMNDYTVNTLFPNYERNGVGINKGGYLSDGKYLPGIGLAQWTGPRARALYDFAKSKGMNWYDLQAQLDFMEAEKSSTFSSLMTMLGSKTISPKQAADAWMTQYEAGASGTNPYDSWLSATQITNRENAAENLYRELYGHVANTAATAKPDDDGVYRGKFIASATNPNAFSGDGYFSANGGATLADYGKPTITSVNINGSPSGNSPLHEFFSKTAGGKAMSGEGNWYKQRNSPNSKGQGSSGADHYGIDFWWDSNTEGRELHATTGGVVDQVQGGNAYNGGCGNNIRWLDDSGYLHWYMHMKDTPKLSRGAKVSPGQLLGYVGNTGDSSGAHLHYSIIDNSKFNGYSSSPGNVNPLLYFGNYDSAGPQTNPNSRGGLTFLSGETTPTSQGYIASAVTKMLEARDAADPGFDIWNAANYISNTGEPRNLALSQIASYYNNAISPANLSTTTKNNPGFMSLYGPSRWDFDNGKTMSMTDLNDMLADYMSGKKRPLTNFLSALKSATGSGDIMPSSDIPPIDISKLMEDSSNNGFNAMQQYVNKYDIKTDDSHTTDMLDKLSSMTFNVRAKRVEELLEILIAKVDGNRAPDAPLPELFDEGIPEAVTRLSMG